MERQYSAGLVVYVDVYMWMWYGAWIWALGYDAHGAYNIVSIDVLTLRPSAMAFPAASPSLLSSRLLV